MKHILDLTVTEKTWVNTKNILLKLTHQQILPDMQPGQFVQVRIDNSSNTFLRRPISIHFVDKTANELWLLIQMVGSGTRKLSELKQGDVVNIVLPLGNSFTVSAEPQSILLVGGGVGVAPLLYYGSVLCAKGADVHFLLGGRTKSDLLQLAEFEKYGHVHVTTEDGSMGESGFVTQHSVWHEHEFASVHACGPTPMMQAVARLAKKMNTECEVSLENTMACGIGACLCCVTDTKTGHKCVCTEGPVFNINDLKWEI